MDSLAKYSRMDQIKFLEDSRKFKGCLQILIGSFLNTLSHIFPKLYINPDDFLSEPSYSDKIKISVQKITSTFDLSSGVA